MTYLALKSENQSTEGESSIPIADPTQPQEVHLFEPGKLYLVVFKPSTNNKHT